MIVPRLKRENFSEAILHVIEDALLSGVLRPGDRLVEADLARRAGTSRGPVREAIRRLIGEGVLVHIPSRGTFVAQWTPQQVEEAYSLRAVLERLAVQEALKRITEDDLARLQAVVDEMAQAARQGDDRALVRLDVRFHEQLYALSGHGLLQEVLGQLRRRLYSLMGVDEGYRIHRDKIAADHQRILDALRSGDPERAGEVIAEHVLNVGAEVAAQVRREQETTR
ncbi:MAG: GntR family transcriptional regulator [Anaerolineae bacterium]|nr:GntR family transcriptional regulator [Anaerolineae bacterium]MCX8067238.1 GntR family transcriptional regulator [Anaerolineae bacterium]MDW7992841.1 GntR family transcriptional regulator [Anaerolineae bacterium]